MKARILFSIGIGILALIFFTQTAQADGIIIPDPCPAGQECLPIMPTAKPCDPRVVCPPLPIIRPQNVLDIRYHHVTVKIDNQVAVVHIDQVFRNPNRWAVEGTYVFPLPESAVISKFSLWVDGKPVAGKVMSADEARQIYESAMWRNQDPALLEYIGRGAFQALIYPIPPNGERRIELEYTQVLTADNNLVHFVYPLNTEKFSRSLIDSVAVTVEITSPTPIRAVYSPSHALALSRRDERHVTASYEAKNVKPDQDFSLYYSVGESEALHLFSFRDPADPLDADGYFMLLLAPKPEEQPRVAKDVILVLDQSGSMEGEKFKQAQAALIYILKHLNPEDRFGLVSFSTGVEQFSSRLAGKERISEAVDWVNRLSARGSTDINRALLESIAPADKERPTYLIFLTDGLPTVGVMKSDTILANFSAAAPKNVRVFSFGVGYDVDTILLDSLSQQNHGLSSYIKPGEKLDEVLSAFYEKISTPVLTNLSLSFGKIVTYDVYPQPLPDLFKGSQQVIVGRYKGGGVTEIVLKGEVNGNTQTFSFGNQSFAVNNAENSRQSFLPRLWATRKIGFLLNKLRLQRVDKETIDQIVRLSIRYGIVTPYTSYLVTEPSALGAENQQRVAQEAYRQMQTQPTQAASGQGAVQKSADQMQLQNAQQAPQAPSQNTSAVQYIGARTFLWQNGVWVDTAYDPVKMRTTPVAFLSEDYFRLSQGQSDVAAALALGERVIVIINGKAFEVVGSTTVVPKIDLPAQPTLTPGLSMATSTPQIASTPKAADGVVIPPSADTPTWVWVIALLALLGGGIGITWLMRSGSSAR